MSELRRDPLTGRWVIIASHRNARPNEFASRPPRPSARLKCPFCAGNEAETPPEIARYPADAGRWSVRVVPNKYPALSPPEAGQVPVAGLLHSRAGEGAHEVIIESPRHVASLTELSRDEMRLAVRVYRDRLRRMRDDGRWRYALVFKNVGALAGASLHHIHSQLLATDLIPPEIQDKLQRIRPILPELEFRPEGDQTAFGFDLLIRLRRNKRRCKHLALVLGSRPGVAHRSAFQRFDVRESRPIGL